MNNEEYLVDKINSYIDENGDFLSIQNRIIFKENKPKDKLFSLKYLLPLGMGVTALILLSVGLAYDPLSTIDDQRISNVYVPALSNSSLPNQDYILPWNDKSNVQKYFEIIYLDNIYSPFNNVVKPIDETYVKGLLVNDIEVNGYDIYENETHHDHVDLYKINKIDQKIAFAVKFKNEENYYAYYNPLYHFSTLGDLVNKLNLKEYLINDDFFYSDYQTYSNGYSYGIKYLETKDLLWDKLIDDNLNLENIYDSNHNSYQNMVISTSVDIPPLGINNVTIGLNDEGYLQTNILGTGKTFYLGKDKVNEFISLITNNYFGERIIYITDNMISSSQNSSTNNTSNSVMVSNDHN